MAGVISSSPFNAGGTQYANYNAYRQAQAQKRQQKEGLAEQQQKELHDTTIQSGSYGTSPTQRTGLSQFSGTGNITQAAYEDQQQSILDSQLRQKGMDRQLSAIQGLIGSGGNVPPRVTGGGPSAQAEEMARQAIFARSKDQAGQIARSGIDSTRGMLSEFGLLGGGTEPAALGSVIAGGQQMLGETSREQSIQELLRAGQLADRNYAGDIAQRGQDISAQQAMLGLLLSSLRY